MGMSVIGGQRALVKEGKTSSTCIHHIHLSLKQSFVVITLWWLQTGSFQHKGTPFFMCTNEKNTRPQTVSNLVLKANLHITIYFFSMLQSYRLLCVKLPSKICTWDFALTWKHGSAIGFYSPRRAVTKLKMREMLR